MTIVFLFGSIFTMIFTALLAGFGVLFAPIAAAICGIIARSRGLRVSRYALVGGVCSGLLFLPWLYLLTRMLGKSMPRFLVITAYIVLHGAWLFGSIVAGFFFITIATDSPGSTSSLFGQYPGISRALLSFNFATWCVSLSLLWNRYSRSNYDYDPDTENDTLLPIVYLAPFGLAMLWILFTFWASTE